MRIITYGVLFLAVIHQALLGVESQWILEKKYENVSSPVGMAFDSQNRLLVSEWSADRVSAFAPDKARETIASGLGGPSGLAIDDSGTIYAASYSGNVVYQLNNGNKKSAVDGLATPAGLSFDEAGNLLIANRVTNEILKIDKEGRRSTLLAGLSTPVGAIHSGNRIAVSNINGDVRLYDGQGKLLKRFDRFRSPAPGVALDKEGNFYVADYGGREVAQITPEGDLIIITDRLKSPVGLAVHADGSLWVGTWGDNAIYRLTKN